MKFNIYNRFDKALEVDTGDKEIEYIEVLVLCCDEFIDVHYIDGTTALYKNLCDGTTYCDGSYIVPKERIQEWIDLGKEDKQVLSLWRLIIFEED